MTDPNAPTLDPVEDRVRRTFAARAGDMASGDSAGALPDVGDAGGAALGRLRGTRRPVLAAAAVLVVVAATAGVALVARDSDREAGPTTVAEQATGEADLELITAPRAVVEALRNERTMAAVTLTGTEGALALPVADTAQARSETDAAVASFAALVAASPDGAAYQPGLDGLGALAELRRDVDADAGPRDLNNVVAAQNASDRYVALVSGVLDDQQAYALTIGDPVVRAGAVAYGRGVRLQDQTAELEWASVLATVQPVAESVAPLSEVLTEMQIGLEALVAESAGTPFSEQAIIVVGEVEETDLLDAVAAALEGPGDLSVILGATDLLVHDQGWRTFLDDVEETLAAET